MNPVPHIGDFPAGPRQTISDVVGVTVGHCTIATGPLQTGVTVVSPHLADPFLQKVPAAAVIINGYPGVDFYFDGFDFAYIDVGNQRYRAYACSRGSVERWGNLPLLTSIDDVSSRVVGANRAFIVIETPELERLLPKLAGARPQVAWQSADRKISIVALGPTTTRRPEDV